jgi:hypothetical protein
MKIERVKKIGKSLHENRTCKGNKMRKENQKSTYEL